MTTNRIPTLDGGDALPEKFMPAYAKQSALTATHASVKEAPYSITRAGAVAGAPTGNRAAIQSAIDTVFAAGGGDVIVPAGEFGVEGWTGAGSNSPDFYALRLKDGVHLRGTGPNSILKPLNVPGAGGQGAFIGNDQTANGNANIWISDLTIDLLQTSTSSSAAGIMFGNPYTNIAEVGVAGARLRNLIVKRAPFLGIQLRGGSEDFDISGCHVHDIYYIGIQVQNSSQGIVRGNTVHDTSDNAIDLSGEVGVGPSACRYVTVSNNTVRDASSGIFLETTSNCVVDGNTATGVQYGVYVNKINSTTRGNVITGNAVQGATAASVKLANNVLDSVITGNTFDVAASAKGVEVANCYRGTITGNTFAGPDGTATAFGITFDNGAWWSIAANIFSDLNSDITVGGGAFSITKGLNNWGGTVTNILA